MFFLKIVKKNVTPPFWTMGLNRLSIAVCSMILYLNEHSKVHKLKNKFWQGSQSAVERF